jgi:hypothetical protein
LKQPMMWDFIRSMTLIRYLILWRVTSPMVILPYCLPRELSAVLGECIAAERSTVEARLWRKALAAGRPWPIEAVLFAPRIADKRVYGKDEVLAWELKLLGSAADHGLFLELILPAMERAALTPGNSYETRRNLWGHFDIPSIYVARGRQWEPLVTAGRLDTDRHVTPTQWAEGLPFGETQRPSLHYLTWITPYALPRATAERSDQDDGPTLSDILYALAVRLALFLPGRPTPTPERAAALWGMLSSEERQQIEAALEQPESRPLLRRAALKPPFKDWPGDKIGMQVFRDIPPAVLPYLELATIVHIGEHTHLGCGTFTLT